MAYVKDKQRNFYDDKRYFQGKDNPGDFHPEPKVSGKLSGGQAIFAVIFFGLIVLGIGYWFKLAQKDIPVSTKPPAAAPK